MVGKPSHFDLKTKLSWMCNRRLNLTRHKTSIYKLMIITVWRTMNLFRVVCDSRLHRETPFGAAFLLAIMQNYPLQVKPPDEGSFDGVRGCLLIEQGAKSDEEQTVSKWSKQLHCRVNILFPFIYYGLSERTIFILQNQWCVRQSEVSFCTGSCNGKLRSIDGCFVIKRGHQICLSTLICTLHQNIG